MNSLSPGDYNFTVTVEKSNLKSKGQFKLIGFNVEQQFIRANLEKMEALSNATEGTVYFLDKQEKLIQDLLEDNRFVIVQKSHKKSNSLILLLFIVTGFSTNFMFPKNLDESNGSVYLSTTFYCVIHKYTLF